MNLKFLRRLGALLLVLTMTLTLLPLPASAAGALTLKLSQSSVEVIAGKEARVTLTVIGEDGESISHVSDDIDIRYANKQIATATRGGRIIGKAAGETTITFTYTDPDDSSKTASAALDVEVLPDDVTGIKLNKTALTLAKNGEAILTATVLPAGVTNTGVTWSSSDEDVAIVDASGKVTAKAGGTATITATSEDKSEIKADCAVTVTAPAEKIELLDETLLILAPGATSPITAIVTPEGASDPVVWKVTEGSGIITLSPDGKACTVKAGRTPGRAIIEASAGTHKITREVQVSGIVLEAPEGSSKVTVGQSVSLTLNAYGDAKDLSYADLIWTSSNDSVASASNSGRVNTYGPGTVTITAESTNKLYKATYKITVEEDRATVISTSVDEGRTLVFTDLLTELHKRSNVKTDSNLSYLTNLRVDTDAGILYYGFVSPDVPNLGVGDEAYYVSPVGGQLKLSDLRFVAKPDFSGTAVIYYNGRGTNGGAFSGTIEVSVGSIDDVTYSTASGQPVSFVTEDFSAVWHGKKGQEITYVTFVQPSPNQGTLYYQYSPTGQYSPQVDSSTKYYRTKTPYLEDISFVPNESYTGTVEIPYRCTTSSGTYGGTVTVVVYDSDGSGGEGDVRYTVAPNGYVTLNASDFNRVCQAENGYNLNYLFFTTPDSDEGTLYYNYQSTYQTGSVVSDSTRYFRSSNPKISNITFVPADGFTGTVVIPFTGNDIDDERFDGDLVITVSGADSTVHYTTSTGRPVIFDGLDFNEACQNVNHASMNWIRFDLPPSSVGTLYRNYRTSGSTGTKITDSTQLTRSALSAITFVPKKSYTGTVSIPFSGYDSNGAGFSGAVKITVGGSDEDLVVRYSTVKNGVVEFFSGDFNTVCQLMTGENLSYVTFTRPSTGYGKLYYQYRAASGSGTGVSASTRYYRSGSSRLLDEISFVAGNQNGIVSIGYTGRSTGGDTFSGTVEIAISELQSSVVRYTGSSLPIKFRKADFQSACSAATGGTLSYIKFTQLPYASAGRLYLNYSTPNLPGSTVSTNTTCYFDSTLAFLPKAEYQGTVNLPYTGWDTSGKSFQGTVTITVANSYSTSAFADLSGYTWAKPSIEFLRDTGISNGYSATQFGPGRQISRGEFALMVCRAFQLDTGSTKSFPDVPTNSVYARAVATAKDLGIVQGNNGMFAPTSPITRQSAMTMICRAMEAAENSVPAASTYVLNSYADGSKVSAHARESVASLVSMGVVRGNAAMELKPTAAISRAEMAVILHRVLTR